MQPPVKSEDRRLRRDNLGKLQHARLAPLYDAWAEQRQRIETARSAMQRTPAFDPHLTASAKILRHQRKVSGRTRREQMLHRITEARS